MTLMILKMIKVSDAGEWCWLFSKQRRSSTDYGSAVASSTGEFTLSLEKNQHGSTTITASSSCGDQSFTLNVTSIDDTIGNRKNNQAYFRMLEITLPVIPRAPVLPMIMTHWMDGFVSDNWSVRRAGKW